MPITRWRARSRWRTGPTTLGVLCAGLWLFGTGEALLVASTLGVSPWTVLAEGLSVRLPLSIGAATLVISAVVLLLWIPLKERPGLGTISNAIVIALALQVMVQVLPEPEALIPRVAFVLLGIACIGLGSGLYLTTNLGPGPRDGWMTGIHLRFGRPISAVRLGIEAVVLVIGWLLGGTVGIGTVLFAVLIGPSVGYGLRLVGRVGRTQTPASQVDEEEHRTRGVGAASAALVPAWSATAGRPASGRSRSSGTRATLARASRAGARAGGCRARQLADGSDPRDAGRLLGPGDVGERLVAGAHARHEGVDTRSLRQ